MALRVDGSSVTKLDGLGSSFLAPATARGSVRVALRGSRSRVPASVCGSQDRLVVRNAVSTEKIDAFATISDGDYAENFRPPHITDMFDIPARPSTFCAKSR